MTILLTLWLPILLSSVFVFIASSLIHMALPWHKSDYGRMPDEEKVMEALRPFNLPPGDYMLPKCETAEQMKAPGFEERMRKGPVMIATVMEWRGMQMGRSLGLWFCFLLVMGCFVAGICAHAALVGDARRQIFQIAGATAFLGYGAALWPISIWYRRSWCTTIKSTIDGAVYAAVTAGTFLWLWPR